MIKFLGLILILSFPTKLLAQVTSLTGKVINSETTAVVASVNISVYDQSKIIYHTISDSTGSFNIPLTFLDKLNYIKISSLNFNDLYIKNIPKNFNDKKYYLGTFKLIPYVIELKEVKVRYNKRYRDTTKIDLSGQEFDRSVMVEDIFSTNGFSKDANGQLYYKGKAVSDLKVNGGDFFGKNNKDVYNLLPALILNDIEVIETNIDSTTNTTTLRPTLKVNLKFKEQYKKGKFGNASAGYGTSERYIAATGLYTYKNKQQISLVLNSNNINIRDIPLADPAIGFSANGNNVKANNARFSYNNTFKKKLEIDFIVNGKIENRQFFSEFERQDEVVDQYSKAHNESNSKLYGITDTRLKLIYKIDSLNTLQLSQTYDYNQNEIADSLNYVLRFNNSANLSNLNRQQLIANDYSLTEVFYKRLFSSKKGRSLNIRLNKKYGHNKNDEIDNVYNLSGEILKEYFVNGSKIAKTKDDDLTLDYIEPINDNSSINLYSSYKNNRINYDSKLISDSLTNDLYTPINLTNQFYVFGIKIQKTYSKFFFDASTEEIFNNRINIVNYKKDRVSFFNLNVNLKATYKINNKKELFLNLATATNYPELSQFTNIKNSYDLVLQTSGNLNLKPEVKKNLQISYRVEKSDSTILSINGDLDYYTSKFGLNINIVPGTPQIMNVDNIGHALSAKFGISLQNKIADKLNINYSGYITYQEQPTIINKIINLNNGYTVNQVVTTSKEIIKNFFSISPIFSVVYSKYYYALNSSNIINLTYSDKLSFSINKFKIDFYPLINYSHNINSLTSFSVNGGIRRSVFNKGVIWIQAYDIFDSFKFNNNSFGPTYTQSIKYSNINRYIIMGLSFKFNNIK